MLGGRMQRVVFAVVAPHVIEIFDTEIAFRVDDGRVSAPAVSLPKQLSLPLDLIDYETEKELCVD